MLYYNIQKPNKKGNEKMSLVRIMSFEKETQLNEINGGKCSYIKLGLYTAKAAKFISDAIEGLIESLPYKYYRYG